MLNGVQTLNFVCGCNFRIWEFNRICSEGSTSVEEQPRENPISCSLIQFVFPCVFLVCLWSMSTLSWLRPHLQSGLPRLPEADSQLSVAQYATGVDPGASVCMYCVNSSLLEYDGCTLMPFSLSVWDGVFVSTSIRQDRG